MGGGYCVGIISLIYGFFNLVYRTVIEEQFYDKNGYYWILITGFIFSIFYEENCYLRIIYSWGILADILASLITHGETQGIYALPALIATFMMFFRLELILKLKNFSIIIILISLSFQLFSKDILLISNTEHGQETVFNQELEYISFGPSKGTWARKADAEKYREIANWLVNNISVEAKTCYFGKNVLLYMVNPFIKTAVPQQFMDYADDTVLLKYYEQYPEEFPDLIIVDVSPTSKRVFMGNEVSLLDDFTLIYQSANYEIYER